MKQTAHGRRGNRDCDQEGQRRIAKAKQKLRPWIVRSRDDVAEFFDISTRVFADWLTAGAPRLELGPRKFLYDLKQISAWRRERDRREELAGDDPELVGSESPALERYRHEKARIAKVEADKAEGLVVDRGLARSYFQEFAQPMKRLGETLKSLYPEAHELLNEALRDATSAIEPLLYPDGYSDEDKKEPSGGRVAERASDDDGSEAADDD